MSEDILSAIGDAIGLSGDSTGGVSFSGGGAMPSAFRTTDFAAASVAAAGLGVASLAGLSRGGHAPAVDIDRRLASFWFNLSLREQGWKMLPVWDAVAGDYLAEDGWIRLHTNAAHHRAAAMRVLGVEADRAKVQEAVARRQIAELETAVVDAGGCAAAMRSLDAWSVHPQGAAVAKEPLADCAFFACNTKPDWRLDPARPLAGIRVLDLTRILAGPVATRFLAGYGADVLRIDPPDWQEPSVIPEIGAGKRCARLDLKSPQGLSQLKELIATADVMVHGYRSDALETLGAGAAVRRALNPGLVDVSLDAYGWTGPWKARRGFDSLLQMSSGIAHAGMLARGADKPVPLPVQALDHGTGYMMAAAVLQGLYERVRTGRGYSARFSLARTAALLTKYPAPGGFADSLAPESEDDFASHIENTAWGPARRLKPPLTIDGAPMRWDIPAGELGRDAAKWS